MFIGTCGQVFIQIVALEHCFRCVSKNPSKFPLTLHVKLRPAVAPPIFFSNSLKLFVVQFGPKMNHFRGWPVKKSKILFPVNHPTLYSVQKK